MPVSNMMKDPDAVLDYAFDWSSWLEGGEVISNHTITVDTGITKDSDSESSGVVTAWLSGGTHGSDYIVACKIITSLSRTDERSINIRCRER
jgi:hypothetical protein